MLLLASVKPSNQPYEEAEWKAEEKRLFKLGTEKGAAASYQQMYTEHAVIHQNQYDTMKLELENRNIWKPFSRQDGMRDLFRLRRNSAKPAGYLDRHLRCALEQATIPRMETFRQPFWLCCQQEILRECAATSIMKKVGWKITGQTARCCTTAGASICQAEPQTAALIFILIRPGPWYSGQPVLHGRPIFTMITGCTPGMMNFL